MEFTTLELRPYFEVPAENLEAFKDIWKAKMDAIKEGEPKNVFYGFSFNGTIATCREGYTDADGLIFHLGHVNEALTKALEISKLVRLEVHGPAEEVEKMREPLKGIPITEFFVQEFGFSKLK